MDTNGGYTEFPFVSEFYDSVYDQLNRGDIEFFVDMAKEVGGPVLEVACGTGRVLIPTARAGIDIVGTDLSEKMLDRCREKLSAESAEVQGRVELIHADMRDFNLGRKFKLVTIPFRPFQHLTTVEDQFSCLEAIHRHLDDDGRFILDVFNPSIPMLARENRTEELGDEPEFEMPDGRKVVRRYRNPEIDFANQITHCELIYYITHPDGRTERLVHSFPMRYLFRYEAEHLLVRCGFEVEHVFSDFKKSPYGANYPGEIIVIARKR
ncbi:MAG: class I SAM-dependent methyltransferase [Candidatus Zixiibacteriota bacterium]